MSDVTYTRDWIAADGRWDIGYDCELSPEPCLSDQIATALSLSRADTPLCRCEGDQCTLVFNFEPTVGQQTQIDQVVTDHKAAAIA